MNILFWIIPPFIGAVIGYVTNAIAIKMLFRPLKEIRISRFRLPFTPGILPRERRKLADSIGRMIEQELLTIDVLRERLAKPEVSEKIGTAVGDYTEQLFKRPLEEIAAELSSETKTESNPEVYGPLHNELPLAEILNDFFNSMVFDSFLEEIIRNYIRGNTSKNEDGSSFGSWIRSRFKNFGELFIPPAQKLIKNGISGDKKNSSGREKSIIMESFQNTLNKYPGITLEEFLSLREPRKQELNSYLAGKAVNTLDDNMENALSSVNIRALVSDRINSLDMLRVEKIILDIMAGQLKWINFFGAILGALIGLLQALLNYFFR